MNVNANTFDKEESDALLKIRNNLQVEFSPGVDEYAIACPMGIYEMVMELQNMYLDATDGFSVILKDFCEVFVIRTKFYNDNVKELVEWLYPRCEIIAAFNGKAQESQEFLVKTHKEIVQDINRLITYDYEAKEEVELNIQLLNNILMKDEEQK
ncbi:hypothetical protein MOF23_07835 [Bacillus inaquosorum]|uniref:hypothetical protein n=1 Tax=Bacillus inaquosorum TaxID=483913 RepID=UPI002281E3D3|nr:hypothetical protein [Bacillus inaquosorum]MCY9308880.1 hypothetical protein [Bacillus inaquosorum]